VSLLSRLGPIVAAGLLTTLAAGCEPTCQRTCKKLVDCDEIETPRVAVDECEDSCNRTEALYEDWDDEQLRTAFDDYKTCVSDESCQAIADGACYDPDLFIW